MKIGRGGMDWLMRRLLAGTVLILLIPSCGRYISRAAGSVTKNECRNMICAGGQWPVEAIWNQAHSAGTPSVSGFWPDIRGDRGEVNSLNPAYRKYNAVKTFCKERQHLA